MSVEFFFPTVWLRIGPWIPRYGIFRCEEARTSIPCTELWDSFLWNHLGSHPPYFELHTMWDFTSMILGAWKGPLFRLKTCMFQFWETAHYFCAYSLHAFPCFVFLRQSQFETGSHVPFWSNWAPEHPLSADSGEFFQLLSACSLFSFLFSDFLLIGAFPGGSDGTRMCL